MERLPGGRAALLVAALASAAGCATGTGPAPDSPAAAAAAPVAAPAPAGGEWSGWSAPAAGLSCRFLPPARVRRGDRVAVRFAVRFDPGSAPPGATHLDARGLGDRVALVLRGPDGGEREARVDLGDGFRVFEDPADPEGVEGIFPLREGAGEQWTLEFPLARGWEALVPGRWEARLEADLRLLGAAAAPAAVRSPPLPLLVEPAPPRSLLFRPPAGLRLGAGEDRGVVLVLLDPGGAAAVDLAPRHGFTVGVTVAREDGMVEWRTLEGGTIAAEMAVDALLPGERGPLDRTYRVEVFETAAAPVLEFGGFPGRHGFRSLWRGTLRITAAAEEVDARRR